MQRPSDAFLADNYKIVIEPKGNKADILRYMACPVKVEIRNNLQRYPYV